MYIFTLYFYNTLYLMYSNGVFLQYPLSDVYLRCIFTIPTIWCIFTVYFTIPTIWCIFTVYFYNTHYLMYIYGVFLQYPLSDVYLRTRRSNICRCFKGTVNIILSAHSINTLHNRSYPWNLYLETLRLYFLMCRILLIFYFLWHKYASHIYCKSQHLKTINFLTEKNNNSFVIMLKRRWIPSWIGYTTL